MLRKPVEELAATVRLPAVESEAELVQVVVQMTGTDGPLVSPDPPTLE